MIKHKQKTNNNQPKRPKTRSQHSDQLTFLEHFHELRRRIFWVVLALLVASTIGYEYKDQVISAIMAPLHGEKLIYLTPTGGFSFIFSVSIYFGALFTIPFAIYHLYRFLEPLFGETSRRLITLFMGLSTLLAILGASFGYFVTIPAAINFLSNFAGNTIVPNLTADSYLGFVVAYVLGLALLFQLPLLLYISDHVRPFKPGFLSATQNYVIIGAAVVSAVITPTPDAFNMMIVMIPIVAVYEIGVLAIYSRRRLRKSVVEVSSSSPRAEPLTAILEELSSQHQEPVKIPRIVNESVVVAVVAPLPAPQRVASTQLQTSKHTVDGFIYRSRPLTPRPLAVPARRVPQQRLMSSRITASHRSLDGFSMV